MKRISFAIIAAVILISVVFAACNGTETGKVSDTQNNDPVLTTLEDMLTEAMTDMENMFTDNVSDTSSSSEHDASSANTSTTA
ncbi:MAG: hypothetical protein E7547_03395 [Ruminococcaceae bacterium]|nr:hypothetical protein [Oscillospiraceae bacterium]